MLGTLIGGVLGTITGGLKYSPDLESNNPGLSIKYLGICHSPLDSIACGTIGALIGCYIEYSLINDS